MARSRGGQYLGMRTIVSWHDAVQDACVFLIAHASDPHLADDTYFPCANSLSDALEWFQRESLNAWLIFEDGAPASLIALVEPHFIEIPAGYVETCTYVDERFRGNGIAVEAWQSVESTLGDAYRGLAGATWCDNVASLSRLRKSGFSFHQKVWFNATRETERSDWCEIWLKSLKQSL